jgi:hypothetical protein
MFKNTENKKLTTVINKTYEHIVSVTILDTRFFISFNKIKHCETFFSRLNSYTLCERAIVEPGNPARLLFILCLVGLQAR